MVLKNVEARNSFLMKMTKTISMSKINSFEERTMSAIAKNLRQIARYKKNLMLAKQSIRKRKISKGQKLRI